MDPGGRAGRFNAPPKNAMPAGVPVHPVQRCRSGEHMKSISFGLAILTAAAVTVAHAQTFTIVDAPGAGKKSGTGTTLLGVNTGGTAFGYYLDKQSNYHGFLRAPDGTFTAFTVDGEDTEVNAINDSGVTAGSFFNINAISSIGFLRSVSGKITTFDPKNSPIVFVNAMNAGGAVAGTYYTTSDKPFAFLWQKKGKLLTFGAPDAFGTFASGVNDSGTLAGPWFDHKNVAHGYTRAADGTFTTFDAAGGGTQGADGT
jgi:hypothetical protein